MSRKERRKASMVLSGLVVTDDAGLKGFRDLRAADPDLDPELLRRARDILDFIYDAISGQDDGAWARVSQAWRLLAITDKPRDKPVAGPGEKPGEQAAEKGGENKAADATEKERESAAPAGAPASAPSAPSSAPASAPSPSAPDNEVAPPPSLGRILAGEGVKPLATASVKPSPWVSPSRAATLQGMPARPMPEPSRPPVASRPLTPEPRAPVPSDSGREPERIEPVPPSQPTMALPERLAEDPNERTLSADAALDPMARGLPFQEGDGSAPAPGLQAGEENEPFGETMTLRALETRGSPLPFDVGEMLKQPDSAADSVEPTMRLKPVDMPRPQPAKDAAPPSLPPHLAAMTIEQYAALCAECDVHAEWAEQISSSRYNVRDRSDREALDGVFRARMGADPQLAAGFRAVYARVEAWARQQRRKG